MLLESKGELEVRRSKPWDYTLRCLGSRVAILRGTERLRLVELGDTEGSAAARLVALSFVEILRSPEAPKAAEPEMPEPPEARSEPAKESEPMEAETAVPSPTPDFIPRAQLTLALTAVSVENAGRSGLGPALGVRVPIGPWQLRSDVALAWLRESLPSAR
ncbi:MAG: hypothetical protein AAFX94_13180, partial [Myxococcota bacterium]